MSRCGVFMKVKRLKLIIYNVSMALLIGLIVAINVVAVYYEQALLLFLGTVGGNATGESLSNYATDDELRVAQEELVRDIVDEGTVLLKNEGALPLDKNAKISILGQSSVHWANTGTGSAAMNSDSQLDLKDSLERAGFLVNNVLWNYYKNSGKEMAPGGSGQSADWSLNETDWNTINSTCGQSLKEYNDAAVVVFSRVGCEGADLPREMSRYDGDADEHYLELSSVERGLLVGLRNVGYDNIIVILKTSNAMQLDFSDLVDACLWLGSTGLNGVEEVGKILNGEVNPSGHLADTLVYDNFSSPAMQNFGDFRYINSSGELIGENYMSYSEGIYVGYKYYETRYEDFVMKTGNAGDYEYSRTVAYPFGYGISYTEFEYEDFSITEDNGWITVNLSVHNVGTTSGKDVVQVYFQSPFTEYDKLNNVEKAAVCLSAFKKTDYINAGESEVVSISFNAIDVMKSYDVNGAGSYILDSGDYYVTVAQDSHQALNNILAKKGYTVEDGMTGQGNADMVGIWTVDQFTVIDTDSETGNVVSNLFSDAIAKDAKYLSRTDWSLMDNNGLRYATGIKAGVSYTTDSEKNVYTLLASPDLIEKLNDISWEASGIDPAAEDDSPAVTGQPSDIKFYDMDGVGYNDHRWDELICQMTVSELHSLYNKAGYSTIAVESIGKPRTYDYDGPLGLTSYISGWNSFTYPSTIMLATSWNIDLAERMGELVGEDGLRAGISGWYAPAMNIHRTPFSGRNYEYYSEDAVLSGIIGAAEVKGCRSKGLCTYVKHFAVNDVETERSSLAVWVDEQTMREIYLKPFEYAVKQGKTNAMMASMNRIGTRYTRGSYALLTRLLRNEWGFEGAVITDFTSTKNEYSDMALAAGIDLQLDTSANSLSTTKPNEVRHALQRAAKNTCYMVATSFMMKLGAVSEGVPVWVVLVVILDVLVVAGVAAGEWVYVREYMRSKRAEKLLEAV